MRESRERGARERGEEEGAVRKGSQIVTPFCHGMQPHLVKLARFWITLATSVSFLDVFSSGYSEHRKKQSEIGKHRKAVGLKGECRVEVCV